MLKSLAVLQVVWIIVNVIIRYATRLPVAQIKIATVAFAIMAVLIYLANWWKPKDTSRPATLQFYGCAEDFRDLPDRKYAFTQRTLSPTKVIDKAGRGMPRYIKRVANDVLWLEGAIPCCST